MHIVFSLKHSPKKAINSFFLKALSRQRPLSYRNQSIDLRSKSMDWFLYDNGLRLERVKALCLQHCRVDREYKTPLVTYFRIIKLRIDIYHILISLK